MFKRGVDEDALQVRLWVMARGGSLDAESLRANLLIGYGNNMVTVRAIKMAIDGALGSRGAGLLEPYSDELTSSGHNTGDPAEIEAVANLAIENGYQMCVHAIGDRANREVLDIYERVLASHPEQAADARFRIEHSQHLHPDDVPRFGELGVIAAMQGVHATSDAPWIPPRLGDERAKWGAYVWQDLMAGGAVVTKITARSSRPARSRASAIAFCRRSQWRADAQPSSTARISGPSPSTEVAALSKGSARAAISNAATAIPSTMPPPNRGNWYTSTLPKHLTAQPQPERKS